MATDAPIMDRRRFLGLVATVTVAGPALAAHRHDDARAATVLACCADIDGRYRVVGIGPTGTSVDIALPDRGHGIGLHPARPLAAVVARRPGTFLLTFDTDTGEVIDRFDSIAGRHFYGHAVFSADGSRLFATENAWASGDGLVGVYDVDHGLERLGEFPSHGIGPHELRLMPDGRTLAVANGGLRTRPDRGREPLNLDTMSPSLAFLDGDSGRLVSRHRLPAPPYRLGIRHLDVSAGGRVCLGLQHAGATAGIHPVTAIHEPGRGLRLLDLPPALLARAGNYCGSVRFDRSGRWIAASCPRGGLLLIFDREDPSAPSSYRLADVCGLTAGADDGAFIVSNGFGQLRTVSAATPTKGTRPLADLPMLRFDNHLA
jgi:hypothetical protein